MTALWERPFPPPLEVQVRLPPHGAEVREWRRGGKGVQDGSRGPRSSSDVLLRVWGAAGGCWCRVSARLVSVRVSEFGVSGSLLRGRATGEGFQTVGATPEPRGLIGQTPTAGD